MSFDQPLASGVSGDAAEYLRRQCHDGIVHRRACVAPSAHGNVGNLALLTRAVEVWTRGLGYELIDLPWRAPRRRRWSDRWFGARPIACPCATPPRAAGGFVDRWEHGELPTAPGYLAWSPAVDGRAGGGAPHRGGAVTVNLFVPVTSADEGRAVLATLVFHEKRLLSSLALHLGLADLKLAVHETADSQRTLRLNKVAVASFGLHAASFGGFVYGTALALPRFADALAASYRVDRARAPEPAQARAGTWLSRATT